MPELPEVETIKREFAHELVGRRVVAVEVKKPTVLDVPPDRFVERVRGAEFTNATRRAKYLVVTLSNGYTLIFHLKISGQLLYLEPDLPVDASTHVVFALDNGKHVRLRDPDAFAKVMLLRTADVTQFFAKQKLGPEPLNPDFSYELFKSLIKRHKRAAIKPLLVDQHFISGIGSIYADEILFYARVHPTRKAGELTESEIRKLYDGIRRILPEAIAHRGTTTRAYRDLYGRKGEHQNYLKVHARAGMPCEGCPDTVSKIELSGKGTYICASCQR